MGRFFKRIEKKLIRPAAHAVRQELVRNPAMATIVGAALGTVIPPLAPLGMTIAAAAGGAVGAVVDASAQVSQAEHDRREAHRAADAEKARKEQEIAAEQKRLADQLAAEKAKADAAAAATAEAKEELRSASAEQERLVTTILESCRTGTLDGIPALLAKLNDASLASLANRPQDACRTSDQREKVGEYIGQEFDHRRQQEPAPSMGMRM